MIDQLLEYLSHRPSCAYDPDDCTCGLTKLLETLRDQDHR